ERAALDPRDRELRAFLARQEKGLALVRKAAALPRCSLGARAEAWLDPESWKGETDATRLNNAARLLALRAWARTADGDAGALEDGAALLRMTDHTPPFFSLPVRMHIERLGLLTVRDALASTKPAAGALE